MSLFCFVSTLFLVLFCSTTTLLTFFKKKGVKVADKLLLTQELEYM